MIKRITSMQNPQFRELLKLRKSAACREKNRIVVEGEDLVEMAYGSGQLDGLIALDEQRQYGDIDQIIVSPAMMARLSGNKSPSKMLGLAHLNEGAETGDRVVVLDNVQDPGNVGTILRTALSFSYSSVVLLPHCASKFNEKVIQSSKGAIFRIPVFETVSLEELKERGLKIVSTSLQGAVDYRSATVREPFALVFGNEGQGISENTLQNSDLLIKIEMHNMDSLNVAVAAGILMNHYRK